MKNTNRVDTELFEQEHYLGKPAEFNDKIIGRRLNLLHQVENFCGTDLNCLEIGCGIGATAVQLSSDFKEVVGIEYYEGHGKEFNDLKTKMQADNVSFQVHNIEEQPTEFKYDRLVSFEVIEHLNSEDGVMNYAKSLKDEGLAIISVPNKWWVFEQHGARLPLLPWNRVPFFSWLPRPLHERWALARIYTKRRIRKLLEKSGFEVLSCKYITAPMDVLPEGWLKQLLTTTIFKSDSTSVPFLSTSIFVVARKKSRVEH
ncbi:MAG: class I SAM-dependent methyltransferase [Bacteroidia bacterium]